jgi:phage/plasmid-like protein (TIGR03299 family)
MSEIMTWHSKTEDRRNPYTVVGTKVAGTTDAREALVKGGLDWTVSIDPLTSTHLGVDGVTTVDVPRSFAVNRINPDHTAANLAVVGPTYIPRQNMDTAAALQAIVDTMDAEFWSVGHTHNGGRTFVQMGLPGTVTMIGGQDEVRWSIVALNRHDGHGKFRIVPTPNRIACENQLGGLNRSDIEISFRHSKGGADEVDLADLRRKLGLVVVEVEKFQKMGDALIAQPFTPAQFEQFTEKLFKPRVGKDNLETVSTITRRQALSYLFNQAPTQEGIRGTRWAAYNAVTEYAQWERTSVSPANRTLAVVTGSADQIGDRALALLS